MSIKFKATKVFHDIWKAINETFINEKNKTQRKYRLIEEVGGSRSSKTWSNFQVLFLYGYENRMKIIVVMRDTASDCRDKVETDWIKWLKDPNLRVKEYEEGLISIEELDLYLKTEDLTQYFIQNKTNHSWTFKDSGSIITFTGTDDEDRAIGKAQNVLWVNEPYRFSEEVFKQLTQRTSDFILVDWNPKQNHFIERQRLKPDTFTHNSSLLDNPFCPLESRKQILSYQPLAHAKAVKNELITSQEAYNYDFELNPLELNKKDLKELQRCVLNEIQKTASEYHYLVYFLGLKAEKPNRIYHWNKITRSEYDALDCHVMYAVDWGKADPFSIVEMKLYDQTVYVRELNYLSENDIKANATPEELAQMFHNVGTHEDEQYNQDTGVVLWLFKKLGLKRNSWMICDNNRPVKRDACKRAGWEYIEDTIKVGMKVDSISMVQNVNICYTDDSPNIEYEHENYSWKVDRYGVTLEEPEEKDDHHMDSIRYGVLKLISEGLIRITV